MTEEEDVDLLAAEYVLGTLDADERTAVSARKQRETALARAIEQWELRLSPLADQIGPVQPPADLLARIEARLDALKVSGADTATIISLERRVKRWRTTALLATAAAACLAIVVGVRETVFAPPPQNFVAVFHRDDEQPSFLMTIDLKTLQLTVRPVTAEAQPGRTYQLWIASDQLGPTPQSLGLIDGITAPTQKTLSGFDRGLLQRATFGISVEPEGGSPTGVPTGPALHGTLYPATP